MEQFVRREARAALGRDATLLASPRTCDQKYFTNLGGIFDCVAYGPGVLEVSRQPDQSVGIDDLVRAAQGLALSTLDTAG